MRPGLKPFFLVDLIGFREYARRLPVSSIEDPEEIWLGLKDGVDREEVVARIGEVIPGLVTVRDSQSVADLAERNPLAGGGWNGLTMFSMVAIGIAVFLTLTVHAVVSIRMGRVDLAVARALGLSRGQIFLSMAMERSVIVVLAVVTGGVMGYWPGLEILELIDLTPRGAAPVPHMLPSVQVWLVFGVISGLVAISAFSVGLAAVAAMRLNTAEVLRSGN